MTALLPIPRLSLAIAGLEPASVGVSAAAIDPGASRATQAPRPELRAVITLARTVGYRGLVLDATHPQTRPRDLERSARREIGALLKRNELSASGVDLFIPSEHYLDSARIDKAVHAALGAIELASELATLSDAGAGVVSVALPRFEAADARSGALRAVLQTMEQKAALVGVRIADVAAGSGGWALEPESPLGVGLDCAAALLAGEDPSLLAARLGARLVSVRITNVSRSLAGVRVAPGAVDGQLDTGALAACLTAVGFNGPVVVDLRGVPRQAAAVSDASKAWAVSSL